MLKSGSVDQNSAFWHYFFLGKLIMSKCGKPYLSLEDPESDLCEETGNSFCKLNVQKENATHTM